MSHLHHKVSALVDGELSTLARRRALAHARGCAACRDEIAETLELKQRLHRLADVELPADLVHLVAATDTAAVPAPVPSVGPTRRGGPGTIMRRALVGAGSLSAVVLSIAYVVGAPQPPTTDTVSPPVEEFAAEFADNTGLAPLADPAVGGLTVNAAYSTSYSPAKTEQRVATPSAQAAPVTDRQRSAAVQLLRQAVAAPDDFAFTGIRVIRVFGGAGEQTFRVRIRHDPRQGTSYDVLGTAGATPSAWFVPAAAGSQPGLDAKSAAALSASYDLAVGGHATVDGRPATALVASRDGAVAARFWIDESTGLLLKRVLYDDGRLVRTSEYTTLRIGGQAYMRHPPPELPAPQATTVSTAVAPALNDKGWLCPTRLAEDFRLTFLHQVVAGRRIVHAEYTDGLSTISVFEERGSLDPSGLTGFHEVGSGDRVRYVRDGLPYITLWQSGPTVITLISDAPAQLTSAVVAHLPRPVAAAEPDVVSRIGDGLHTLASAVTP